MYIFLVYNINNNKLLYKKLNKLLQWTWSTYVYGKATQWRIKLYLKNVCN